MRVRLIQLLDDIRSSYWFVPTVMALAAAVLFVTISWMESRAGTGWIDSISWLGLSRPAGARAVLSTIAGSMIGVAGVTFSITIAAVSFASANFGPRLLTNFLRDRGNQFTLGTFIATYLYCLLALRTVRDGAPEGEGAASAAYVPQATVLAALALALCSLGVLIYFLHHVPDSIRLSSVVAVIGGSLIDRIAKGEPSLGGPRDAPPPLSGSSPGPVGPEQSVRLLSPETGYLQHVSFEALIVAASEHEVVLWLDVRTGDFLHRRQCIGRFQPTGDRQLADDDCDSIAEAVAAALALGRGRTQAQDLLFPVDELVEIASRAISPGVNDPFTAMMCLDWLGGALIELANCGKHVRVLADTDGEPRVLVVSIGFEEVAARVFEQMRPYLKDDLNAALHALRTMATVATRCRPEEARGALLRHAQELVQAVKAGDCAATDRSRLADELSRLRKCLREGAEPLRRHTKTDEGPRIIRARE